MNLKIFRAGIKSAVALGILALAVYACYLPRFYVGGFNDDAAYILAAKALWLGSFCRLSSPVHAPINLFLPGYPLFLMPFVKLADPHWAWLKATTLLLTLASGLLLAMLWERQTRLWIVVLTAFFLCNPVIALYSGSVMTDPCFSFAVLLAFVIMRQTVVRANYYALFLAIVLSWVCLIRPIGVLLAASMCTAFFYKRRFKAAFAAIVPPLAILAAFLIHRHKLTRQTNNYLLQWKGSLSDLRGQPLQWLHNLADVLRCFFAGALLGFPYWPASVGAKIMSYSLTLMCVVLMGMGYARLLKKDVLPREVLLAMGLWVTFYVAVHSFWTTVDYRYAIPLIPLSLSFLFFGLKSRRVGLALLCISYGVLHVRLVQETWSSNRPAESLLPEKTYQWLNRSLPRDALLYSKGDVTFLYTGRRGVSEVPASSAMEFHEGLRKIGVSYVVCQSRHIVEVKDPHYSAQLLWNRSLMWTATTPAAFQLVYQNDKERTQIYRVR